ncbi:MAG: flippase-like domain-containing protein [Melioribacteraceae bacterium]|nr:flippase-like domain-containing protein [Melioribacteraceae bacterium]
MLSKIKKHIIYTIIAASLIYLLLTVYADYNSVINLFYQFGFLPLALVLGLSLLNYYSRFLKWHYYLHCLDIRISHNESLIIFLSGLVMSVTPGKFGELLKSFMLKQNHGIAVSRSAPIVLVERITDFLSLLIIAVAGGIVFDAGLNIIIITSILFIALVLSIGIKDIGTFLIKIIGKIPVIKKYGPEIFKAYESAYILVRPRHLFNMILLSFTAWFFECFGFYLILSNFSKEISLFWASFTYAFSTILGSISMLPGGLGITDGSLTYLILQNGLDKEIAVASTLLIRIATLWFALFVGIISLIFYQKIYGVLKEQ